MSNSYFKFKQFTIHQDKAAMKVCTDACLFGAWVAKKLETRDLAVDKVLDIGTGTGLLSLMIAQKSGAHVDAIEIDEPAAEQARENFAVSLFKERLSVIQADIKTYTTRAHYNLIISNPPFYQDDLKSKDQKRNFALHSAALSFEELISCAKSLMASDAFFAVLLPYHRTETFIRSATTSGLVLHYKVLVKQTEKHTYFRSMLFFGLNGSIPGESEIVIKKEGVYSPEFIELLKDYYLYL